MAGEKCFLADHLQAHYRRIGSAKGRVDSSPPVSMLKDVRRKRIKHSYKDVEKPLSNQSSHESVIYNECIELANIPVEQLKGGRGYHTQTGRGLPEARERPSDKTPQWKPVLNSNSRQNHLAMYPTLLEEWPNGCHGNGASNNKERSLENETKRLEEDERERPFRKILQLQKVNEAMRDSITVSELEYRYDKFLLDLTRDILSRGVMSDKELVSLCGLHIDRNKYQLREDIMLKKVCALRERLGL